MKVLLYLNHYKLIEKSGIGKAITHQKKALEENGIDYTTDSKENFDIIHINTVFPSSFLMSLKAKHAGKKVVIHAHSTEEDFRNSFVFSNALSAFFKRWIIMCYKRGDVIITPTLYSKKLIEGYGIKKPVISISNGINTNYFKKTNEGRKRFRQKYNLNENDKVIISVGLYFERKGILDFVELAKSMPEYKFIWFGSTNLNMVPSSVKKAVGTKLSNLFFPGYVSGDELKDAYSGSDLFLFLTYEETEGIVLLEALSMKIPSLVRDIPIYENLKDGEDIYKGKDLTEFRVKIKDILNNRLPSLVESGHKIAKKRDINEVGKQLKQVYSKLYSQ